MCSSRRILFSMIASVAFTGYVCAAAGEKTPESAKNLGFGFRLVTMGERDDRSFESVVHYTYLFFGERELGRANGPCIAPSGRFAIYEVPETGALLIFDVGTGATRLLTKKGAGVPAVCKWDEKQGAVTIDFYSHERLSFGLLGSEESVEK